MAGSNSTSTREKLLGLVDDIELITKEILENAIAPKAKRLSAHEHDELTSLLIQKNSTLKETMILATEQGKIDQKMKLLEDEVQKQDNCIKQLQKNLKDAETVLSTAIYQARQKLESIQKAKENPVSSEELIKYAHRISASNAVSAPLNWQQGDPRRPYPTDIEMRLGFLGKTEQVAVEMSRNAQASGERSAVPVGGRTPSSMGHGAPVGMVGSHHNPDYHHPSPPHQMGMAHMHVSPNKMHHGQPHHHPHGAGGPFSWSHGGDMSMARDGPGMGMDQSGLHYQQSQHPPPPPGSLMAHGGQYSKPGNSDDVEVMSTDSSSSSSTDSN